MSKGSGSQTQTTKSEPWEGQAPYLRDIFSQAQNMTPQQFYPNQTYANPDDILLRAEQLGEQQALGGQQDIANALVPGFTSLMADPSTRFADPMFQEALRAGTRPMEESASRLLQQARRGATKAGQLGGSRQGILESEVIKDLLTKQSGVASRLYGDVYGDALKSQAVAMQNIPTIMSGLQAPAQTLQQLGNIRTARAQLPIDEAMQRYKFNQNANLANLQNYSNLIGSPIPGTQTTTQPGAKSNPLLGLLGAAGGFMIGGPSGAAAGFGIGNQL
tara:strand:- start:5052 stop:5876 length:825 start_codon:yes stop_codon:yes gene_type:complete